MNQRGNEVATIQVSEERESEVTINNSDGVGKVQVAG